MPRSISVPLELALLSPHVMRIMKLFPILAVIFGTPFGGASIDFPQSFRCTHLDEKVSFNEFALDLVLLWDEEQKYDKPELQGGIANWLNWMKNSFAELRVATASYHDDDDHQVCYNRKARLEASSVDFTATKLRNRIQYSKSEKPPAKTMAISGALWAAHDHEVGWGFESPPTNDKIKIRMVLVLTDKEPMPAKTGFWSAVWRTDYKA